MKIGTASLIRRFVAAISFDTLFSTRDCLHLGKRSAVDQALYRLVKNGIIFRVARGHFVKTKIGVSAAFANQKQIAIAKAKAFHRKVHSSTDEAFAALTGFVVESSEIATDADSTSFRVLKKHDFRLQRCCPRQLALGDTKVALLIRFLWKVGRRSVTDTLIISTLKYFGRSDNEELKAACRFMPAWLATKLVWNRVRIDIAA